MIVHRIELVDAYGKVRSRHSTVPNGETEADTQDALSAAIASADAFCNKYRPEWAPKVVTEEMRRDDP